MMAELYRAVNEDAGAFVEILLEPNRRRIMDVVMRFLGSAGTPAELRDRIHRATGAEGGKPAEDIACLLAAAVGLAESILASAEEAISAAAAQGIRRTQSGVGCELVINDPDSKEYQVRGLMTSRRTPANADEGSRVKLGKNGRPKARR